jgi:hypothetical protein
MPILTCAKYIHSFSLPCADGDFDEHELGKILVAKRKELNPAKLFGGDGVNPKAISIIIHLEGFSTYRLSTRVIPQDDSRRCALRQLSAHL